ncbi:hypothetical protein ACFYO6_06675 [Streptomyces anthocyanicus]|uniref:hypothetical protein n=1 Tax=Streptomyces anthocyanicus TaxID=68174 RepID=UPI003624D97F
MTEAVIVLALLLVALSATAVVAVRDPVCASRWCRPSSASSSPCCSPCRRHHTAWLLVGTALLGAPALPGVLSG